MDRALDLLIHGLPVYTPLTREGEIELARQFERGEVLILEGIIATEVDARAVLIGAQPEPKPGAEDAPLSWELTPHRLEIVTGYVEQINQAQREGISRKERTTLLCHLVSNRNLTRVEEAQEGIREGIERSPSRIGVRSILVSQSRVVVMLRGRPI